MCPNECSRDPIPRGELPSHLSLCAHARLVCGMRYGDAAVCGAEVRRCDMAAHEAAECALRPVACANLCGVEMCARDAATHSCIAFLAQQNQQQRADDQAAIATLTRQQNALQDRLAEVQQQRTADQATTAALQKQRTADQRKWAQERDAQRSALREHEEQLAAMWVCLPLPAFVP